MLKNKFSYYFWRVAIGVSIGFILMFARGHVFAATINTTDTFNVYYDIYMGGSYSGVVKSSGYINEGTPYSLNSGGVMAWYSIFKVNTRIQNANTFKTGYTYTANFGLDFDPREGNQNNINDLTLNVLAYNGNSFVDAYIKSESCTGTIPSDNAYRVNISCVWTMNTNSNYVIVEAIYPDNRYSSTLHSSIAIKMRDCSVDQQDGENVAIQKETQLIIKNSTNRIINSISSLSEEQHITNEYIQDDSDPNIDVSGMAGVQGLLPAGPLDSLLALPVNLLNILVSSTSGTCQPFTFTFVFDSRWQFPCFDSFWNEVPSSLLLFMSDLPAVYIFIKWAKSIYTRVERAVSFESSVEDEWGGV